jgi:hypothetical protein
MGINIRDTITYAKQQAVIKEIKIKSAIADCETELQRQAKILDGLRDFVLDGFAVSDDSLHDGIVAMYGGSLAREPKIFERYERVGEAMKGKIGDIAVTFSRAPESMVECSGFGGRPFNNFLSLGTTITLGILTGEDMVFDFSGANRTAALPTERYAVFSNKRYSHRGITLLQGDMVVDEPLDKLSRGLSLGYDLDEPLIPVVNAGHLGVEVPMMINVDSPAKLKAGEILIGQEAVSEWLGQVTNIFEREDELAKMKMCCRELGIEAIEGVTPLQRRTKFNK